MRSMLRVKEPPTQHFCSQAETPSVHDFYRKCEFLLLKTENLICGFKNKRNIEFFPLFFPQFLTIKENSKEPFSLLSTTSFEPLFFGQILNSHTHIFHEVFFSSKRIMLKGRKVPFLNERSF